MTRSIIEKINQRGYYDKFARKVLEHFQNNLSALDSRLPHGQIRLIKRSISYRLYFDSERNISKITITSPLIGLFVDLGVGTGVKLPDIGYQKIGRTMLGRKVNGRRARRWYLKTIHGQTIRLMGIVAKDRGDQFTVMLQQAFDRIGPINLSI